MIISRFILGGPPAYDDAVRYNQGMPAAKPM